ncbi:ATP-binding protein [Halanaerobacter jeridensis]|uniref:histidine kinase n=1 Tax=Halanaerobacter jeridensis TaxID=706427 RepID=A0A938XXY8_9FIRM|nr:ATP-binding protein [Halanaerobacter jeridensis]MBM7557340.1 PAS domain S-box-containing protein [Halanaerobacter jeridensis]
MKKTIKREITIKTGGAILLILFIIFSFLIYNFRTVQITKVKEQMNKSINNIAFKIDAQNHHMVSLLQMMVNYQKLAGFGKRKESVDYLFDILDEHSQVLGAAYCYEPNADGQDNKDMAKIKKALNSTGRFMPYVVRKSTGQQEVLLTKVMGLDKQFYQQPKKTKELTITDPFNYQGTMMVSYSAPIIIDNQFKGIAAIDRSLEQIQNYLHSLNSFSTSEFYLISPNDRIIATSKQEKFLGHNCEQLTVDFDFEQGNSLGQRNDKFWVSATVDTGQWQIVMSIDKQEALAKVNDLTKNMIGLGILAVILLSLFLYYLIYQSLKPIPKATIFAQNLAAENFNTPYLNVESEDEIGQLATALNKMKDKLHSKIIKINQSNKELEKEKNKLEKYLNITEVMFVVIDRNNQVKLINDKGAQILGLAKKEIKGQNIIDNFVSEEEKEEAKEHAKQLLTGEKELISNFETTVVNAQGEERIIIWNCTVLKDDQGKVQGILNSGTDITEQRLLQEELEYNKLKTQFFANLSHEFKTPLNLILSSLQMLEFAEENNSQSSSNLNLKRYTKLIKQNSYRLLRLVNNLVDLTRINANSFELNYNNYDLVALIRNITLSVQDYVENKNRHLSFNTELETQIMACDFFSLERIMLNLISNAVKFTDEGDRITVGLKKRDNKMIISVADTGVGIPETQQETIFQQFRQVNKSFTRSHEGSGIGLSLVKSLVEMHEGQIRVESTLGEGSKFIIELPITKIATSEVKDKQPEDLFEMIELEFADLDTK